MSLYKVKKRNGTIVSFEFQKIESAIKKAMESIGVTDYIYVHAMSEEVVFELNQRYIDTIPDVENIQDEVETILMKSGYEQVARAYILYRHEHKKIRENTAVTLDVGKTIDEYLDKSDWRVNANANAGYSLGWLILNTSGKVSANYWLSYVYPSSIGDAHRNGDYHIHDLDMLCGYCAGWSLRQLLEEGFNGMPNRIESAPPKNLQSAVNQMINFFWTLQNEWAGAQAFSSFDTYLSPFVHKYMSDLGQDLEESSCVFESEEKKKEYIKKKAQYYTLQQMQNFVFGLNVPSRWGTQTPFTNITLDWSCPEDLKDQSLHLGWYSVGKYHKTYGELDEERKIINQALLQVYAEWDHKGRAFTFPIPTYNITEDFPWESEDVNPIFDVTAKYGLPYFQNFLGSQYITTQDAEGNTVRIPNEAAYKPGAVRSMCCRLQLDLRELIKRWNWLFGSAEMTGSIGVVTLNMARIGYLTKWDPEAFRERIHKYMDLAKESLEIKRKTLSNWLEQGLYPYTYRYLRSFRNHFSTIGLNGMNEAIQNFTGGYHDISTEWGRQFAIETLDYMREILKQYQEETGNMYNLEATPAEGTTYRFAREDQKQHPDIIQAWTQENPYYTNSTQLPVDFTDDAFESLEYQDTIQCKYTWGTVLHLYMGERISDVETCKRFVKTALENYRLPYITVTPTFSICPKHGYITWEHDFCPKCDAEIGYKWQEFDMDFRASYTADREKFQALSEKSL
jgi:anaerobic ribonucleoside-triphosphate reductase